MQCDGGGKPCRHDMQVVKTELLIIHAEGLCKARQGSVLGSVPDCVILDGAKNADEGIQQEPYEANSKSNAAHHDPAVPDPPT